MKPAASPRAGSVAVAVDIAGPEGGRALSPHRQTSADRRRPRPTAAPSVGDVQLAGAARALLVLFGLQRQGGAAGLRRRPATHHAGPRAAGFEPRRRRRTLVEPPTRRSLPRGHRQQPHLVIGDTNSAERLGAPLEQANAAPSLPGTPGEADIKRSCSPGGRQERNRGGAHLRRSTTILDGGRRPARRWAAEASVLAGAGSGAARRVQVSVEVREMERVSHGREEEAVRVAPAAIGARSRDPAQSPASRVGRPSCPGARLRVLIASGSYAFADAFTCFSSAVFRPVFLSVSGTFSTCASASAEDVAYP